MVWLVSIVISSIFSESFKALLQLLLCEIQIFAIEINGPHYFWLIYSIYFIHPIYSSGMKDRQDSIISPFYFFLKNVWCMLFKDCDFVQHLCPTQSYGFFFVFLLHRTEISTRSSNLEDCATFHNSPDISLSFWMIFLYKPILLLLKL